jgi:hypothetical protein
MRGKRAAFYSKAAAIPLKNKPPRARPGAVQSFADAILIAIIYEIKDCRHADCVELQELIE